MSITVRSAVDELESWDDYLEGSPQATPFHQEAGLKLLEDHSDSTLHPLIGYKGEQPIAVLPVFEHQRGPFTMVDSPPKGSEVYYLGPAMLGVGQVKQRKLDRRNRRFINGALDWIDEHIDPDQTHIRTVDRYEDHRPFKDRGYDVSPYYTYVVDLTKDWESLLMEFSSDARSNVRNADESTFTIEPGTLEDARTIIAQVAARHEEQGKPYHIDDDFVTRLYTTFPDEQVTPYAFRVDDEVVGGMITLEYGETIYRWQGGATPDVNLPVNDLLDAHIIQDAMDRGLERYDLVGANTPRLCRYKAKFAPELRVYHGAKKRSRRAQLVSTVRRSMPIDV